MNLSVLWGAIPKQGNTFSQRENFSGGRLAFCSNSSTNLEYQTKKRHVTLGMTFAILFGVLN